MEFYLTLEAKNGFKQWTRQGLEYLLAYKDLPKKLRKRASAKLKELKNETK